MGNDGWSYLVACLYLCLSIIASPDTGYLTSARQHNIQTISSHHSNQFLPSAIKTNKGKPAGASSKTSSCSCSHIDHAYIYVDHAPANVQIRQQRADSRALFKCVLMCIAALHIDLRFRWKILIIKTFLTCSDLKGQNTINSSQPAGAGAFTFLSVNISRQFNIFNINKVSWISNESIEDESPDF